MNEETLKKLEEVAQAIASEILKAAPPMYQLALAVRIKAILVQRRGKELDTMAMNLEDAQIAYKEAQGLAGDDIISKAIREYDAKQNGQEVAMAR